MNFKSEKGITLTSLIIYGVLLIVSTILGYIENYPEQQVNNKLYLDFKLQALKKMKTIEKNGDRYLVINNKNFIM